MSKAAAIIVLAVSLTAVSLAANSGPGPEVCQVALLRNGFTIQYARSEGAGQTTRLWLCADAGSGFIEVASGDIVGHEALPNAVPPAPSPQADPPKTLERDPLEKLIAGAAGRQGLDPDFVASVVKAESGFVTTATSPKGAQGLMQLMPHTAATLGVTNVFDPASNLEGGTRYLRQLLDRYEGDAVKALAAYNAGPQRVAEFGGMPPFPETYAYVARIIQDYNRKKLEKSAAAPAGK
ncbi:MAG TPA: lytic transglycosylase domain-containing protein [Bryobacteraceae bacterium]|nr:lytic transglycosylase domain-containing protein [Bryobacteraceae bacterium]